jgi:hypothetical protein
MNVIKITAVLSMFFLANCSLQKMTTSKLTDSLTGSNSTVFTGDDDPKLIGDALPFALKFYETMLSKDSTNPKLYLTTGMLFALYAQAYVQFPADTLSDSLLDIKKREGKRAKKLFLRARDYATRGFLISNKEFARAYKSLPIDSALSYCSQADTNYLYWTAVSWMGAIAADRSDLGLSMSIKKPIAMINKLLTLNESYNSGSVHELLCTYYGNAPKAFGGDSAKARIHFNKAVEQAKESKVSVYVTGALTLAQKNGNNEELQDLLTKAISIDINKFPELRLQNTIYQQKASHILKKFTIDD